ncbi:MAG TPA: tripartite tricarboxylate transporter substrate binding protein [Casimicrobiaceae bacterium]|jgi:tripartite-type tricarboxylate transporter receptor subunit TctC|nr:tripartite tricarboxylate transporter substrate binding protein [Casimicrobiaceae bacterium]
MQSHVRWMRLSAALALAASAMVTGVAVAQDRYPSRPIEFIVPWGTGGGADQVARKLGQLLEPELKVSLPVINVPGATGQTGHAKLMSANPDGYTIEVMTGDTFALLADPGAKLKLADFIPLGIVIQQASGFFAAENGPYKTWADVEKAAKEQPLKVAVTGFNSPDDITVNYFVAKGLKLNSVPYAKPSERYTSVLGGHADLLYEQAGDVRNFVDTKQIRPLIFFYGSKVEAFPNVPVSTALGHSITLPQFRVILVKAGTDASHVKLLSDALAKAAASPDFKAYLKEQYADEGSFIAGGESIRYMQAWLDDAKKIIASTPKK